MNPEIKLCIKKLFYAACAGMIVYAGLLFCSEHQRGRDISIFHIEQIKHRLQQKEYWPQIIMGDSRALAFNFNHTAGADIYNFAFSNTGGMYPYVYFLNRYLENHAAPRQIFWAFIPLMLTDTWEIFKQPLPVNAPEIYRSSRLYALDDILFPTEDTAVFYHYPYSSKAIVHAKFDIDPEAVIRFFTRKPVTSDFNGLYNPGTGALLFSRQQQWEYSPQNYLEQTDFVIAEQSVTFLRHFLNLARQHKIKVHCFNMPIPEIIYKKRLETGFYAEYFSLLNKMKSEFPQTFTYSANIPAYACRYFIDGSHLNEAGAEKFMHDTWPAISAPH